MRRNGFNEAYCHTVAEIEDELSQTEHGTNEVYATPVSVAANEKPCLEVLENASGETLLYIEADTEDGCRRLAEAAEIDIL